MSGWGSQIYGDPCRECGFSWGISRRGAEVVIAGLPDRLVSPLGKATGTERNQALTWTVTGYVAHLGDNLGIWAERVVGITLGAPPFVAAYDQDELARARRYDTLRLQGVFWSLRRAVDGWLAAFAMAPPELVMTHPDVGTLTLVDVARSNAHDASHHEWDIARSLPRSR
ncbi:MAG: maleylpyruvate isomerase N-terminal domain-containing protein [Acidimicrobiales bacterium]|nr:maleylpyruvate isomerase N-terminal domain-containing protein [Acidimicrobiales bacterium]